MKPARAGLSPRRRELQFVVQAEEHLAAAQKNKEVSSHLYAATALVMTYGGKGKEALTGLEKEVKTFDGEDSRSFRGE